MLIQLYAVARNALVEAVRQPFYIVWLGVVIFALILSPFLAAYTFDDDDMLATDMGLSMLLIGGLVLAAFSASGVVSREIEDKTALTVISKPLARPVFVLGKYIGIAVALALAWWVWTIVHVLAIRQGAFSTVSTPWDAPVLVFGGVALLGGVVIGGAANYLFGKPFGSTTARWLAILLPVGLLAAAPFDHAFAAEPTGEVFSRGQWLAAFMILEATMLFAAVAVACSTRLGQAATLSIMLVVFLLGLTSDYTFGRLVNAANESGTGIASWAQIGYAAIPNLQFYWLSDALSQGSIADVGWQYVGLVSLYGLALIVGILALAVALFQTRDAS